MHPRPRPAAGPPLDRRSFLRGSFLAAGALALPPALLAACGDGMKGRYEGEGMLLDGQAIVFHGNGKATQEANGMEVQLDYEVDGDKVKLRNPDQPNTTLVLIRTDADTLTGGPMGLMTFKREK